MATLLQILQGTIAGVSILATTVAVLYAASWSGVGINLVVDGQVVEITASQVVATAADLAEMETQAVKSKATPASEPQVTSQPAETESEDEFQASQPPAIPASAVLDYYNLIAPDVSAAVISLGRLSQLLENPRPQEEGWRTDVIHLIDMISDSYEHLIRVQPPTEATAIHSFLMDSTGRCLGITESLSGDLTLVPSDLFPVIGKTLQRCIGETKSVVQQVY